MKLYLAVAVLILAFVAFTEAQDTEIQDKTAQVTQKMAEFGKSVVEQLKAVVEKAKNSDIAESAGNMFTALKKKIADLTQS